MKRPQFRKPTAAEATMMFVSTLPFLVALAFYMLSENQKLMLNQSPSRKGPAFLLISILVMFVILITNASILVNIYDKHPELTLNKPREQYNQGFALTTILFTTFFILMILSKTTNIWKSLFSSS